MKTADAIRLLKRIMPKYTNIFSDNLSVSNLQFLAGTVTCTTTSKHSLAIDDDVFIKNAITTVDIVSITATDGIATATTTADHDLTFGYQDTVTITGADQGEYNGEHKLIYVQNRLVFSFQITGDPVQMTGSPKLHIIKDTGFNGLHKVADIIDDYKFTYYTSETLSNNAIGSNIIALKNLRITGDVTIERFLQSYTMQELNNFYLVVANNTTTVSKDRTTTIDATNTSFAPNTEHLLYLIESFGIYVIAPSSDSITALDIRDFMVDLLKILNKALLGGKLPSIGKYESNIGITFTSHGMFTYDIAYYIHVFNYEYTWYLTNDDGVDVSDNRAFRDFELAIKNSNNNNIAETLIDLDNIPLKED